MSVSIHEILRQAVVREESAQAFYKQIAERSPDAFIGQLFTELANDELGHKEFLQRCLKDPGLLQKLPTPPDFKVAEGTDEAVPGIHMKPAEAIALAMKREQDSVEHYRRLAASAQADDYRRAFTALANMELNHKKKLEEAFVNIGYPEVF